MSSELNGTVQEKPVTSPLIIRPIPQYPKVSPEVQELQSKLSSATMVRGRRVSTSGSEPSPTDNSEEILRYRGGDSFKRFEELIPMEFAVPGVNQELKMNSIENQVPQSNGLHSVKRDHATAFGEEVGQLKTFASSPETFQQQTNELTVAVAEARSGIRNSNNDLSSNIEAPVGIDSDNSIRSEDEFQYYGYIEGLAAQPEVSFSEGNEAYEPSSDPPCKSPSGLEQDNGSTPGNELNEDLARANVREREDWKSAPDFSSTTVKVDTENAGQSFYQFHYSRASHFGAFPPPNQGREQGMLMLNGTGSGGYQGLHSNSHIRLDHSMALVNNNGPERIQFNYSVNVLHVQNPLFVGGYAGQMGGYANMPHGNLFSIEENNEGNYYGRAPSNCKVTVLQGMEVLLVPTLTNIETFFITELLNMHERCYGTVYGSTKSSQQFFRCNLCPEVKLYKHKHSLREHYLLKHVPSSVRPYKCECGLEFVNKWKLKKHQKTHEPGNQSSSGPTGMP